jgi:hypothetical protein
MLNRIQKPLIKHFILLLEINSKKAFTTATIPPVANINLKGRIFDRVSLLFSLIKKAVGEEETFFFISLEQHETYILAVFKKAGFIYHYKKHILADTYTITISPMDDAQYKSIMHRKIVLKY